VTAVLDEYARGKADSPAAVRIGYAIAALSHFWEGKTVANVHDGSCRQYSKRRGVSAGTVRRELTVLRAAINYAVKTNQLTRGADVTLPGKPEPRDVWLTRSEFAKLLWAARKASKARGHLPLFMLIAVYTGRRKQAILGLRWAKVDLINGKIDFRRNVESNKRRGVVAAHRKLLGHLRRARQNAGDLDYVIQWGGRRIGDIRRAFAEAVQVAGLNKHVTPHTLKHTCATWLVQGGTPLLDVARFLATSMATIERVYAHHCPEQDERALRAFG
jgi:integrase